MQINRIDLNAFITSLLPPQLRTADNKDYVKALNVANDWLNLNFTEYVNGTSYSEYDNLYTYSKGDRVDGTQILNGFIYESLQDGNLGNSLTDTNYWLPVVNNSVGAWERSRFCANKMTFEWALNRYFGTNFRQNLLVDSYYERSDIYIDDSAGDIVSFLISDDNPTGYIPGYYYEDTSMGYITETGTFVASEQYIIWVPLDVFNRFTEVLFRKIIDKYNYYSIKYKIQTY